MTGRDKIRIGENSMITGGKLTIERLRTSPMKQKIIYLCSETKLVDH